MDYSRKLMSSQSFVMLRSLSSSSPPVGSSTSSAATPGSLFLSFFSPSVDACLRIGSAQFLDFVCFIFVDFDYVFFLLRLRNRLQLSIRYLQLVSLSPFSVNFWTSMIIGGVFMSHLAPKLCSCWCWFRASIPFHSVSIFVSGGQVIWCDLLSFCFCLIYSEI